MADSPAVTWNSDYASVPSGDDLDRTDDAPARVRIAELEARCKRFESALVEIKTEQGHVCGGYELCRHRACASSHASREIAYQALAEHGGNTATK